MPNFINEIIYYLKNSILYFIFQDYCNILIIIKFIYGDKITKKRRHFVNCIK